MMLLKRLRVAGYRAIGPRGLEVALRRLTVIIGPNSSAKTTILELLSRAWRESIGTVEDTYKALGNPVTLEMGLELSGEEVSKLIAAEHAGTAMCRLITLYAVSGGQLVRKGLAAECGALRVSSNGAERLLESLGERVHYVSMDRLLGDTVLIREGLGLLMYTRFPDPEVYGRLLRWLGLAGRYTRLRIIPLRGGESARIEVYDGAAGEWVGLGRAAGGLRLALPYLFLLAAAEPGEAVLIDDLELGLHPAAQRRAARAVVEAVKRGVQVVLTTHSPLVLGEALLAVRRGELRRSDVVIVLLYRGKEGDVAAEHLEPVVPLRPSEEALKALSELGASGVFGEEAELALELAAATERGGGS